MERGKIVAQLQPLENLIIALLVQEYTYKKLNTGSEIEVVLKERKLSFLNKYISRYHLTEHVEINIPNGIVRIKQSVTLLKILKEWTVEGEVVAIEPKKLTINFFMLWLCLFGKKTEKNVVIESKLTTSVKNTMSHFFETLLKTKLIDKGNHFQVLPFTNILLFSYQRKGTLEETAELNYLLPERDRLKIKKILFEWEEEHEKVY